MRNDFKDYAVHFLPIMHTLCAPLLALYYTNLAIDNEKKLQNQLT